ncbi:glycosyl hydrolase [Natronobiforma cellulositropha]|uniref:glycosyl hydrolase n=1 Tax=Natronobiforma cellulositropha TaxID=1679076 RepID=UPI0021D6118C|nr:glycosyl hydrolase [Natronobiforma cellulositropha]
MSEDDTDLARRTAEDEFGAYSRRAYCTLLACLAAGAGASETVAATVSAGSGGYHDGPPPGAETHDYGRHTTVAFGDRPVPTNDWYSAIPLEGFTDEVVIFAHPLSFQTRPEGLRVGHPTTWTSGFDHGDLVGDASMDAGLDLTVGHAGASDFEAVALDDHGDWSARVCWDEGGPATLRATIAQGSPFAFFEFEGGGGGGELAFDATPEVWAEREGTLGVSVGETAYGLFAPDGASWDGLGSATITTYADACTVAVLPAASESHLERFARYAQNRITDTRVEWAYDRAVSTVTSSFHTETVDGGDADGTLSALYPHQWKYLAAESDLLEATYPSARGELRLLEGASFTVSYDYGGLLPFLPDVGGYDEDQLAGYLAAVDTAIAGGIEQDTYWFGKDVASRLAKTAAVADQVGTESVRDALLESVREGLEAWFTPSAEATFYYDDSLGVLQGVPASHGSVSELNDHHFHFGHYVWAAARLARHDPDWADEWGPMVEELIRDYANPRRDDERYPFSRNFSVYAGHAWAHGSAGFALGNNQESSSEALMAYAALIEWGEYTGDEEIRDFGIYLYATHVRAVEEYWFDRDDENHPEEWAADFAGIVWGNGYAFSTWWTTDTEAIFGINMLPLSGYSLHLGRDPDLAADTFDQLVALNETGDSFEYWPDVHWMYRAFSDSTDALARFEARKDDYEPEAAQERAHTYFWLSTLDQLGSPDPSVTADTPLYAVFTDGGERTYAAYNASGSETTVTFSDGTTLSVPPHTLETTRDAAPDLELNGYTPQDLTGDGRYEDVTGDGQLGFNDVVTFFDHLDHPTITENPAHFDFSGNGRVGFDDVIALFGRL